VDAGTLQRLLDLEPLRPEGGFFRETYRSPRSSAIYYLLTPEAASRLHRLPHDEIWHFYLGDPVEMLHLRSDGTGERLTLGTALESGQRPQVLAPAGVWQGARLAAGGRWALMGTTMAPGFDGSGYEHGDRTTLVQAYPSWRDLILALTEGGC